VSRVRALITSVSDASAQQSDGIAQTAHAIQQMERVTQAAASEQLSLDVDTSRHAVREPERLVGSQTKVSAGSAPAARPGVLKRAA
jgi:methyl-accepting chemotaxis protein